MMFYPGDREEIQRVAAAGSCSPLVSWKEKGEGMVAGIQEPGDPAEAEAMGACPAGGKPWSECGNCW